MDKSVKGGGKKEERNIEVDSTGRMGGVRAPARNVSVKKKEKKGKAKSLEGKKGKKNAIETSRGGGGGGGWVGIAEEPKMLSVEWKPLLRGRN